MKASLTRYRRPHSLALLLAPLPALVLCLTARGPAFPSCCLAAGAFAAVLARPRTGLALSVAVCALTAATAIGMALWLPDSPERPVHALTGALRVCGSGLLAFAPMLAADREEIEYGLVQQLRAPYRLVAAAQLAERIASRMHRQMRLSRLALAARLGGRPGPAARFRLIVPVLASSLRYGGQLADALDARGFGALPTRTMPRGRRLRIADALWLASVWTVTVALAVLLG